jgi:hypothetical protein
MAILKIDLIIISFSYSKRYFNIFSYPNVSSNSKLFQKPKLGAATVARIVSEITHLWQVLQLLHIKPPTEEMFREIFENFWRKWDFPNSLGAHDGEHIPMKCRIRSRTMFYNYKKYCLASSDASCEFIFIAVGVHGRQSDEDTFQSSEMYEWKSTN